MADTKIATSMAAFFVPHECLSGAKISINPETSKQFPKFNIKQRDAGHETCIPFVLSYYKNNLMLCDICEVIDVYLSNHHRENEDGFERNVLANLLSNMVKLRSLGRK